MKRSLQYCLALLLLLALVYLVDLQEIRSALQQMTLEQAVWLAVISFVLIYCSALKWQLFLQELGSQVSVWRLSGLYLVGYFFNLIFPSFLGGDAVRSWQLGKQTGKHEAFAATILERYTGLLAMVILGALCSPLTPLATPEMKIGMIILVPGVLVGTLIALSGRSIQVVEHLPGGKKIGPALRKVQAGFHLARRSPVLLLRAMFLSFLFHSVTVINTMVAAHAVGWQGVPVMELFVVLPLILLIGAIPLAPAGLGVQEGAFYFFLTGLGATPAQALGVALVLRAKSYCLALLGGLLWFFRRKEYTAGDSVDPAVPVVEACSS